MAEITHRWRWLGVEFVVIALGVLSALFVDTLVEERQDAQREAVYLQRLEADLQRDISNLDTVIAYYTRVREYSLATLADLEGTAPLDDFQLLFSAFNAAEEWGFQPESSTWNDLQSTGGLSLIRDVQFRIELADYYRQGKGRAADVWYLPRAYRETVRGIIPNPLQAAIHESCVADRDALHLDSSIDLTGELLPASTVGMGGSAGAVGQCGLDPDDFELTRAAEELRNDPGIPRLLRYRISQMRVALSLYAGQRDEAVKLHDRLSDITPR